MIHMQAEAGTLLLEVAPQSEQEGVEPAEQEGAEPAEQEGAEPAE